MNTRRLSLALVVAVVGLCAVLTSATATIPATNQCYFLQTASAAGSVGKGCGSRGAPVCCNNKPPREPENAPVPAGTQCIPGDGSSYNGGGCTTSAYPDAACCPATTATSPSPKSSPATPASPPPAKAASPPPATKSGSSPAPPPPPPPPAGGQITQSRCQRVETTASAAGSFGSKGCGYTGTPYCCNQADTTCVPDTSGSTYGGSCPASGYTTPACCY